MSIEETHRFNVGAAALAVFALLFGCSLVGCSGSEPMASGTQHLEASGPDERTAIYVSGPEGVTGGVTRSKPVYFPIELRVKGPPGTMSVIRVPNPSPRGCNVSGGLPAYAVLDGSGEARVEAFVTFWAERECRFEVVGETGTDYEGYRPDPDTGKFMDYELSGSVERATLSVRFTNLDPS
jgi:hypothetical protein